MLPSAWKLVICIFCCHFFSTNVQSMEYYVAAVYEHNAVLNPNAKALSSRNSALKFMGKNLEIYEEQVIAASEKVLQQLSCMATKGRMFLVANLGIKVPCDPLNPPCPSDGRYQFNTDVVFSDNGTFVASYFKQNLYFEDAFDTPPEVQHVVFDTPFASKFGIFTCFDILFLEPAVILIEKHKVQHIIYPTAWMNQLPLLSSIQIQRGFATAFNVNVLAANIHHTTLGMTGSGIYSPLHSSYHYDMESESSKLILSKVPVIPLEDTTVGHIEQMSWIHSDDEINSDLKNRQSKEEFCEKNEQIASCDGSVMTDQILPSFFQAEMMYDNFTFTPLSRHEGKVRVCAETLCCYLNYKKTFPPSELYAFGVFDGLHTVHGNYSLQICAVVKCGGPEPKTCGHEVTDASSVINFELWGNFSTRRIYPLLLTSGVTLDLPDYWGWKGNHCHMHKNNMSSGLVTGALYGRFYERD
ncbi:biotinidase isoform 2-T2 [Discoglossus pictus]